MMLILLCLSKNCQDQGKFKSTPLLYDIENFHNVRHQKLPQIVRRQKHKIEHGTCDKKFLTPPPIRICPLFDELKKGDFFYPPPSCMDQCLLLSNFFLKASLSLTLGHVQIFRCDSISTIIASVSLFYSSIQLR